MNEIEFKHLNFCNATLEKLQSVVCPQLSCNVNLNFNLHVDLKINFKIANKNENKFQSSTFSKTKKQNN